MNKLAYWMTVLFVIIGLGIFVYFGVIAAEPFDPTKAGAHCEHEHHHHH